MKIAVISDIHGNSLALKEVLRDIGNRSVDGILNLGDSLYGPLDPSGTADIILQHDMVSVSGNQDRIILDHEADSEPLRFVRNKLNRKHLDWLKSLQSSEIYRDTFFLCHGTPWKDDEYLLWQVSGNRPILRESSQLMEILTGIGQRIILCGHDHTPMITTLPDGRLIVNPGSVGLPAYIDDEPSPHAMQSGSPHARYALLDDSDGGWKAEIIQVDYDWEKAARIAAENNRPDWKEWLLTGKAEVA